MWVHKRGYFFELCRTMYAYTVQMITCSCVHVWWTFMQWTRFVLVYLVLSIKHGDWLMLVSKRNQQQVDMQSYCSFDGRLQNNDCMSFCDMYCGLRCLWATSGGLKSLPRLYWWMLGLCTLCTIGLNIYSKVYLYTYVNNYMWM